MKDLIKDAVALATLILIVIGIIWVCTEMPR